MKRLNREINIFSMSALDLFASAMGTFILLTVVLFPYYLKNADIVKTISTLRQELEKTQQQLQNKPETDNLKQDLKNCQEKLKQTFLAVVMKWQTQKQDVDLHVIDPNNNEFYYQKHNRNRSYFPNANAELSVDTTNGPGIEIWENPLAKPGIYKIYAHLYARKGNHNNPIIKTTLYYRDGSKTLPNITLNQTTDKKLIAEIEVNADGKLLVY